MTRKEAHWALMAIGVSLESALTSGHNWRGTEVIHRAELWGENRTTPDHIREVSKWFHWPAIEAFIRSENELS